MRTGDRADPGRGRRASPADGCTAPAATSGSPAPSSSTRRAVAPAGCSSPCPASGSTGTTSPPPPSAAGRRRRCSPRARSTRPRVIVPPVPRHVRHLRARRDRPRRRRRRRCWPRWPRWPRHVVDTLVATGCTVVGITGASGKTSTKDLLAAVLAPLGPTVAPPGSFNNELGPALDRAARRRRHPPPRAGALRPRARATSRRCAGSRRRGSAWCSTSARAHLGEFGSREAIAQAKGELVEALPAGRGRRPQRRRPGGRRDGARAPRARVVHRSGAPPARRSARPTSASTTPGAPASGWSRPAGERRWRCGCVGAHHVGNALAAAAVALELGPGPRHASPRALAAAAPRVALADGGHRAPRRRHACVNDAYNANPESMRAALRDARRAWARRRTWAVLGADGRARRRRAAARTPSSAARSRAPACSGSSSSASWSRSTRSRGYGRGGVDARLVPTPRRRPTLLQAELAPGDVVLVKASRVGRAGAGGRRPAGAAGAEPDEGRLRRGGRRAGRRRSC